MSGIAERSDRKLAMKLAVKSHLGASAETLVRVAKTIEKYLSGADR